MALNDEELVNSARVIAHMGGDVPTTDIGTLPGVDDGSYSLTIDADWGAVPGPPMGADAGDWGWEVGGLIPHPEDDGLFLLEYDPCVPIESVEHPGLGLAQPDQEEVSFGLWSPPSGARIFGPGLFVHDQCWGDAANCLPCRDAVSYDDSWPGQRAWLRDSLYRPELAPWYCAEIPESAEFGGVWLMQLDGLDSTPVERQITQAAGPGAVAGPNRDTSRTLTCDALLLACTNAGVEYGLKWLTNLLRKTALTDDTRLKYLTASPARSTADPDTLVREAYGVVLTQAPKKTNSYNIGPGQHHHGDVYRISWEFALLDPYAYLPAVDVDVAWDRITRQPVNWIHAADCAKPEDCTDMPVMFSADCTPEIIAVSDTPPPVCGGCLPVNAIDKYSFNLPTMEAAFRGRETAMSLTFTNTGSSPLTLQAFLRVCNTDIRCEDNRFPLQISALPPGGILYLDGVTGRYKMWFDEKFRKPVGVVGTPNGAPWRPPLIDRQTCWDFIVQAAPDASFTVSLSMADREP